MAVYDRQLNAIPEKHAWTVALGLAAVTLVSIALNARIGTGTDVSWIISIIERMLAGKRLYIDIIEVNPPFSIWLYFPVVSAAGSLSVAAETAVRLFAYLIAFAGLGLTMFIVRRGRLLDDQTRWWTWPAILAVLLVLPGGSFEQREHFGLMLFLPMLAIMAWRLVEAENNRIPLVLAVVAGIAGSVIILVKPHWAMAVVLPAIYIARSRRSPATMIAPEFVTIGTIAISYLAAVAYFHPEFLQTMYPMLKQLYLPIRNGAGSWPQKIAMFALALSVWALWRIRRPVAAPADISAIAAVGFFVAMLFLGKGWNYHLYPAIAAALIASILALEHLVRSDIKTPVFRLGFAILAVLAATKSGLAYHGQQGPDERLVQAVRKHQAAPRVAAIGADIGLAFPFARLVGGSWTSAYCSDWAGAHALFRLLQEQASLGEEDRNWLEAFLAGFVKAKTAEFRQNTPDVIIAAKSGIWVDHLFADPAFKKVMTDYEPLAQNDQVAIWRRKAVMGPLAATAD